MYETVPQKRLISFLLCVSLLSLTAAFFFRFRWEESQRREVQLRQQAYSQLVSSVSSLETALQKARCCGTSSMLSQMSSQIWREAAAASQALSSLPPETEGLASVQKFINQTGEYAYTLIGRDTALTGQEYATLTSLHQAADRLSLELLSTQADLGQNLHFPQQAVSAGDFDTDAPEQEDYPSLTYDGPFSDHLDQLEPLALQSLPVLSPEEALTQGAAFCGLSQDALTVTDETQGTIPCYRLEGENISLLLTKQGGRTLLLTDGRALTAPTLSPEQGAIIAQEFLRSRGYSNMCRSYYETNQGTVTVNFAPVEEGRLLYPDLIKVTVALDNGTILGFESRGYVMNHQAREFTPSALSIEEAETLLSPLLTVKRRGQAIIPSAGAKEIDCYEFLCSTSDGAECLVYLNTQTGEEENILLLLTGENGVLTA